MPTRQLLANALGVVVGGGGGGVFRRLSFVELQSDSQTKTAAAVHMAATKHNAAVSEPLRLRKRSELTLTQAVSTRAQPSIVAASPYRGRTKHNAMKQTRPKYG